MLFLVSFTLSFATVAQRTETRLAEHDGSVVVPAPLSPQHERFEQDKPMTAQEREQVFSQIIVKCILQLLLIEMTSDLLKNNDFYSTIPPDQLLKLMGILSHSYQFARMFNEDKQLRTELWRVGEYLVFSVARPGLDSGHRFHEAPSELAEARIHECGDPRPRTSPNVFR
jgi:hypothetical protein